MTKKEAMVKLMEVQGQLTKMNAPEEILKALDKITEKKKLAEIEQAIADAEKYKAHMEQEAKKAAQKPAASAKTKGGKSSLKPNTGSKPEAKAETKTADKPKAEKTADKPKAEEKKSPFVPVTVEDENGNKMELVPGAKGIQPKQIFTGEVWIAQYTPQELLKSKNATGGNILYSAKNPTLSKQLRECKASEYPIAQGIDLFRAIAQNDEAVIFQSEYTEVFNSYNKKSLVDAINAGKVAVYTIKPQEAPKKKAAGKNAQASLND